MKNLIILTILISIFLGCDKIAKYQATEEFPWNGSIVITKAPIDTKAGETITIDVEVQDESGKIITYSNDPIKIKYFEDHSNGTIPFSGIKELNFVNGKATFDLVINKVISDISFEIIPIKDPNRLITTDSIDIIPNDPTQIVFLQQPTNQEANQPLNPNIKVAVWDEYDNTVPIDDIVFSMTFASDGLPGPCSSAILSTTDSTSISGIAEFTSSRIDEKCSGYKLEISSQGSWGSILPNVVSSTFDIPHGPADHIVFVSNPNQTQTDQLINDLNLQVLDLGDNIVLNYNGSFTMSIQTDPDGSSTLRANTVLNATNGLVTFSNLGIDKTGTGFILRAESFGTFVDSSPFNITPGAANHLSFLTEPTGAYTVGSSINDFKVVIQDIYNNQTSENKDISISIGGQNKGTVTSSNGTALFSGINSTVSNPIHQVNATSLGLTGALSNQFTVVHGTASYIIFDSQPTDTNSNSIMSPFTISVRDIYNNICTETAFTHKVYLNFSAANEPSAGETAGAPTPLPSSVSGTVSSIQNGIATFNGVIIDKSYDDYRFKAITTLTTPTSIYGPRFKINATSADHLTITSSLTTGTFIAGSQIDPITVEIHDQAGNLVTSFNELIDVYISSVHKFYPATTLFGTTQKTLSNGSVTFDNLSLQVATDGMDVPYELEVEVNGQNIIRDQFGTFHIRHESAHHSEFLSTFSDLTANTIFSPVSVIHDQYHNPILFGTEANATINLSIFGATGTLDGTTFESSVSGTADFNGNSLKITRSGIDKIIRANCSICTVTDTDSSSFEIFPNSPDHLVVEDSLGVAHQLESPIGAQSLNAGQSFTAFSVLRDTYGNFVKNETVSWSEISGHTGDISLVLDTYTVFNSKYFGTSILSASNGTHTSDNTGTITVSAGNPQKINIETSLASDGTSMNLLTAQTITAGGTQGIYAVSRDAFNNFVDHQSVSWQLPDAEIGSFTISTGSSTTFEAKWHGLSKIVADHATLVNGSSANINVIANTVGSMFIETTTATSGTVQNLFSGGNQVAGAPKTLYAIARDQYGNYISNPSVSWSQTTTDGSLSIPSGSSSVYTPIYYTPSTNIWINHLATYGSYTSPTIDISAGTTTQFTIETAIATAGTSVNSIPNQNLKLTENYTMFSNGRDQYGNFTTALSINWLTNNSDGTINLTGSSGTFIPLVAGSTLVTGTKSSYGSDTSGTITIDAPINIYRSVGQTASSLAAGSGLDSLTISNGTGLFGVSLSNNIGIGDALIFDQNDASGTSDSLAFIHQRISASQYLLKDKNGLDVGNSSSTTTWYIYRSYTFLADADSGDENTSIANHTSINSNFDTFNDGVGPDLISDYKIWNLTCYGDSTLGDTKDVNLGGWITGLHTYLKVFTPTTTAQVGTSQRHSGEWSDDYYYLDLIGSQAFEINNQYTKIVGIQFDVDSDGTNIGLNPTAGGFIQFGKNIITNSSDNFGIAAINISGTSNSEFTLYNNIIYDFDSGSSDGISINNPNSIVKIFNNTVYEMTGYGIDISSTASTKALYNIVNNTALSSYNESGGTFTASDWNISDNGSNTNGTNDIDSGTVIYNQAPFFLDSGDTIAKDKVPSGSIDSDIFYSDDISDSTRSDGTWDIGAHEY